MNLHSILSSSHTSASSDFSGNSTDIIFYPESSTIMCVNISVTQNGAVVMLNRGSDEGVVLIDTSATVVVSCKFSDAVTLMAMGI